MHEKAIKDYQSAPAQDRARATKIIDHLSEHGPSELNDKQFKQEGRYLSSGGKILVCAVKSYQLRVYGGWVEKPRAFVCPEVAIKKDKKADQEQLKRVAKKVGEL